MKIKIFLFYVTFIVFFIPQLLLSQTIFDNMVGATVIVKNSQRENTIGSGILFSKKIDNVEGQRIDFVLTCAHVIGQYKIAFIDYNTNQVSSVVYNSYFIEKETYNENGEAKGIVTIYGKLIYYNLEEDVAILMLNTICPEGRGGVFYQKDVIPKIGTSVYHIGHLSGMGGSFSLTKGIISKIGRITELDKKRCDQTTCFIVGGSSGGPIFLETGEVIGMAVSTHVPGFSFFIPIRRIKKMLELSGIGWVIDSEKFSPNTETLNKMILK